MSVRAQNKAMMTGSKPAAGNPKAAAPTFKAGGVLKTGPQKKESSKKQAERVRKDYAARTRNTHRKIFKKIDPKSGSSPAAKKAAKDKEEAEAAEAEFKKMLEKQEEESRAMINQWRLEANEKLKARRVADMAGKWKKGARDARIMGPYTIPAKLPAATEIFAELRKTPKGAVVAFLLALLRKGYNRKLGNEMLAAAIHQDCVNDEGIVRKFSMKMAGKIDSQILASYVVAATPDNGYAYNPESISFEFDNLHTPKFVESVEGASSQVFIKTSGPLPTYPDSRPVEVKFKDGVWGVRTFAKLTTAVVVGTARRHSFIEDEGRAEFADYQPVKRNEYEAWTPAPDFAAKKRAAKRAQGESEAKAAARRSRATAEVSGLAGRLADRDLKKQWAETNPNEKRRIMDGDGNVREVSLAEIDGTVSPHEDPEKVEAAPATALEEPAAAAAAPAPAAE